jgi:serine/threonine protein kinase
MARERFHPGTVVTSLQNGQRYRLLKLLSAGEAEKVWLCDADGELRAVKIIRGALHEVEREAVALDRAMTKAGLYVPRLYEASVGEYSSGQPGDYAECQCGIIVMEYIDGMTVRAMVQSRQVPESVTKVILHDAALALGLLHEAGIVHRDINPENIIVSRDGHCYLCSFGLTLVLDTRIASPLYLPMCGSPLYMSPELCEFDSAGQSIYDEKVDLWALGMTAYVLATGRCPMEEKLNGVASIKDIFENIIANDAPRIPSTAPYSADFSDMVAECLERDASKRSSAEDLVRNPYLASCDDREELIGFVENLLPPMEG